MKNLYFGFTKTSKTISDNDLTKIFEKSWNGIIVLRREEETPLPYDAVFEIEKENLNVEGGLAECGFGSVEISLPLKNANEYYVLMIEQKDEKAKKSIIKIMKSYNYEETAFNSMWEV